MIMLFSGRLMVGFVDGYSSKARPHKMQNILTFIRTIEQFKGPILDGKLHFLDSFSFIKIQLVRSFANYYSETKTIDIPPVLFAPLFGEFW